MDHGHEPWGLTQSPAAPQLAPATVVVIQGGCGIKKSYSPDPSEAQDRAHGRFESECTGGRQAVSASAMRLETKI